jgi:hypothetical protein
MKLTTTPVQVATGHDEEGCLVFGDDRLLAVLVRLSNQHEDVAGQWFLEAGFGELDRRHHPIFADLEAGLEWIVSRLRRAA